MSIYPLSSAAFNPTFINARDSKDKTPLYYAIIGKCENAVEEILVRKGDKCLEGDSTYLVQAIRNNCPKKIIELLFQFGSDVLREYLFGNNFLGLAAEFGNLNAFQVIMEMDEDLIDITPRLFHDTLLKKSISSEPDFLSRLEAKKQIFQLLLQKDLPLLEKYEGKNVIQYAIDLEWDLSSLLEPIKLRLQNEINKFTSEKETFTDETLESSLTFLEIQAKRLKEIHFQKDLGYSRQVFIDDIQKNKIYFKPFVEAIQADLCLSILDELKPFVDNYFNTQRKTNTDNPSLYILHDQIDINGVMQNIIDGFSLLLDESMRKNE